jgi:hypothetical protein
MLPRPHTLKFRFATHQEFQLLRLQHGRTKSAKDTKQGMGRIYYRFGEESSSSVSKNLVRLGTNLYVQEIYATDPEGYREYLKGVERKGKEVIPKGLTDEEKIAQMETNMKALIDHDPDLIKSFDIERMKKSFTYMNKVKVG